jgi:hypothetical protein
MSQVVKVVNVFNTNPNEENSGFVTLCQSIATGLHLEDEYGHYAVAEAEPLPGKTVARSADDSRVF